MRRYFSVWVLAGCLGFWFISPAAAVDTFWQARTTKGLGAPNLKPNGKSQYNDNSDGEDHSSSIASAWFWLGKYYNQLEAFGAIGTAILGIGAAYSAATSAYISAASVKISERDLRYTYIINRAFVIAQSGEVKAVLTPNNNVDVWTSIQWKNIGNTPTRRMMTRVNFFPFAIDDDPIMIMLPSGPTFLQIPEKGTPADNDFIDRDERGHPDLPAALRETDLPRKVALNSSQSIDIGPFVIQAAVMAALEMGRVRPFIWGWAEYDDRFPDTPRHRTEFCFEMTVTRDRPESPREIHFKQWGDFNGNDEDCFRHALQT